MNPGKGTTRAQSLPDRDKTLPSGGGFRQRLRNAVPVWALAGLSAILVFFVKPVQDRVDSRLGQQSVVTDQIYLGSPAVIKKMALGYEGLLADVYWMRAIQYYGRREEAAKRPVRYKNLGKLLDITTTLDPDLLEAYRSGSSFLAEPDPVGAGQPQEAIALLDKGIRRHPLEWRLFFDKGFLYYWFLQDYRAAGETWLAASRLQTAPAWMAGLAASALSRSGAVEIAKALWQLQYQQSDRADVKDNARNHLLSIRVAEDIWTLEFFVDRYREHSGEFPQRLTDLVRSGMLKFVPADPLGTPYQYDPSAGKIRLSPDTKVRFLKVPESYREIYLKKLSSAFK